MKHFLDTEFFENGSTIDLISIGIVSADGSTYYSLNKDHNWQESFSNEWVKTNVLRPIYEERVSKSAQSLLEFSPKTLARIGAVYGHTRQQMADTLKVFCGSSPEFWGYYADYDWVVFCQIFGTMMDLPKHFPMYCRDIKQLCDSLGNPKLPPQSTEEHNALNDAAWNKEAYDFLLTL